LAPYCGHDLLLPSVGAFLQMTARGGFNEANSSRRLRDGLGSYRNGHHSSGENAVGTDCEGWGTSTRRRFADAAAYGRASRQGESAHWQGQGAGRDQVLKGLGSPFSHRPRGAEAAPVAELLLVPSRRASPLSRIVDNPFILFLVAFVAQWCAAYGGDLFRRKVRPLDPDERQDLDIVVAATLTLLGLIIGFSFSMAVNRYDQRKNYEAAEANAIGTEYVRADLLPADDAVRVRELLGKYVSQRIAFYLSDKDRTGEARSNTAKLQAELWSAVVHAAPPQSPVAALAVSGMNDVLNSQGYTQAAWWNRIPVAAWILMGVTAIFSNLLLGYRERRASMLILMVLPVIVSIAFFLIADIDSTKDSFALSHKI
jgi:hypothetical protein